MLSSPLLPLSPSLLLLLILICLGKTSPCAFISSCVATSDRAMGKEMNDGGERVVGETYLQFYVLSFFLP